MKSKKRREINAGRYLGWSLMASVIWKDISEVLNNTCEGLRANAQWHILTLFSA